MNPSALQKPSEEGMLFSSLNLPEPGALGKLGFPPIDNIAFWDLSSCSVAGDSPS